MAALGCPGLGDFSNYGCKYIVVGYFFNVEIFHMKYRPIKKRGFALVVTLTLMILLTIIAVGLLTLSSVALRTSGQGEAMAVARGNARLGMMLALGELQRMAGPDKAVTASSEILGSNSSASQPPRLTGVWDSWNPLASATAVPDYAGQKRNLFRGWLASDPDPEALKKIDYTGPKAETVCLVGPGSLVVQSPGNGDMVHAGKVPVHRNGKVSGGYAWHVSDESQKARINAYRDPSQVDQPWKKCALTGGHRPDVGDITGIDGSPLTFLPGDKDALSFSKAVESSRKLLTFDQFGLLPGAHKMGVFRHHVTPYSHGLLTDVRNGGFKQDLTSMFEMTSVLPKPYDSPTARLYQTTHGITGASDPFWSVLKGYYDIGKEASFRSPTPVYYQPPREAITLANTTNPPSKYYPAPVIARVEMLFSLVVRDSHGPWSPPRTGLTQHTRMVHLLYAPVVTLHNPYNVSLKFDKIDIDINGIPIAFNFVVNGEMQNKEPISYNRMYVSAPDRTAKAFMLSISNWNDFSATEPTAITMSPGQSLVCGPYINGDAIFGSAGREGEVVFFDYSNNLTGSAYKRAKCKPGFLGRQVSFDIDWITPDNAPSSTDGNRGVLIVKPEDKFYVEYKMKPNANDAGTATTDKMTVSAKITSNGSETEIGGLQFDYDTSSLNRIYPSVYRYPDARSVPNVLTVENLWESNFTSIRNHAKVASFALLSVRARTTNGGVYDHDTRDKLPNGENLLHDGSLAGKPFLHHNPARTPTVVDLKKESPGRQSYELNLQPLKGNVDDIFSIDRVNRGYLLSANKVKRGIKSGSYLELPTGPMQAIADFRRSNVMSSSMLPHFVQPIANSYSSPLIGSNKFVQPGVAAYPLLDHSVLGNHALYDRFYFSTAATYGGVPPKTVFADFMAGRKPLSCQAFAPYVPPGSDPSKIQSELFSGNQPNDKAFQRMAGYQWVRTPFNVNSTDVKAWRAVLSSMRGSMVQLLWAANATRADKEAKMIPFLPMSLVNAGMVGGYNAATDFASIDSSLANDWNGFRHLSASEIETLATRIVEQVRLRGPFLSLSEFVNRQIGSDPKLSISGAIQAAIDDSGINASFLNGSVTPVRDQDVADANVYGYNNPRAAVGNPAAGAPGWLSQGDIMRILEPGATVRGDTFVIRSYGESVDASGKINARAYAEAVVQRLPEYLNPLDQPYVNVWDPAVTPAGPDNRKFGRRIAIVGFRWLAENEI